MAKIISNQATATYSVEGSSERRNVQSNIASTTLLDAYGLEVSKQSLQQTFSNGENVTYTIRVTNKGYRNLNNFTITDDLATPSQEGALSYLPFTARLSINGDFIVLTPTSLSPLTFSVANTLLSNETFTITYVAVVGQSLPTSVLELTNTATVTARSAADLGDATQYSASDTATIYRNNQANLSITKQVSKPTIRNSDSYEYILTITNNGLTEASNVVITDNLPEGFAVSGIRVENEDFVHDYEESEYVIDGANLLTLPSESGTAINVRSAEIGKDNATIIHIYGNFNAPQE